MWRCYYIVNILLCILKFWPKDLVQYLTKVSRFFPILKSGIFFTLQDFYSVFWLNILHSTTSPINERRKGSVEFWTLSRLHTYQKVSLSSCGCKVQNGPSTNKISFMGYRTFLLWFGDAEYRHFCSSKWRKKGRTFIKKGKERERKLRLRRSLQHDYCCNIYDVYKCFVVSLHLFIERPEVLAAPQNNQECNWYFILLQNAMALLFPALPMIN